MKQKYIQPKTELLKVETENMMALSDRIPIDNTPGVPGARNNAWDDEWDF